MYGNSICCWVRTRNDIQPDRSLRHVMLNLRLGLGSHCLTTILRSSVSSAPAESPFYKLHWCWVHSSHKGHQSSGRQTICMGDRQVGDKPTGRQPTAVWATHFGQLGDRSRNGPQLWKCERLTIAVLEQCAVIGQRPFNITHQANFPHSSLECYTKLRVQWIKLHA